MKQTVRFKDQHIIFGLILLGFLLRFPFLKLGLFRDEGSTYFDAVPPTIDKVIETVILSELNPPGFFLIMHQWIQWFGAHEVIFKVPALIFGLLLIPATYGLGRLTGLWGVGSLAALFTTLTPTAVYYSQEARPYTLTALLSCISMLLYCKALTSKYQRQYLLGFVLCSGCLVYVHYAGLVLVAIFATVTAIFWLSRREPRVSIVTFALVFGTIFLLFLPWLPTFLIHLFTPVPWESKGQLWEFPSRLVDHLSYTLPLIRPLQKFFSFVVLLVLGIRIGQFFFRAQSSSHQFSLLILEFTLGMLVVSMAYLVSNGSRYLFPFFPIAWVVYSYWLIAFFRYLNGRWVNHRFQSSIKLALVFILIGGIIFPSTFSTLQKGYQAQYQPKSGMRPLVVDVKKQKWEKTVFLIAPNPLAPSFCYYATQALISGPVYGFPSWDNPEVFKVPDYVRGLQNPMAVTDVEQRIRNEIRQGYRNLAFVTFLGGEQDHQIGQLLARLKLTYPLLLAKSYSGAEPVTLYLFGLQI